MSQTPSARRREGRNAYCAGMDPEKECPYKECSWHSYRDDWIEGWHDAETAERIKEAELDEEEQNFVSFSYSCPWQDDNMFCEAIDEPCLMNKCAPYYFKNSC